LLDKPTEHCDCGSYAHVVPCPVRSNRVEFIDFCVLDLVAALNAASIRTTWSCCGHGVQPGAVALADGRYLTITDSREGFEKANTAGILEKKEAPKKKEPTEEKEPIDTDPNAWYIAAQEMDMIHNVPHKMRCQSGVPFLMGFDMEGIDEARQDYDIVPEWTERRQTRLGAYLQKEMK